jgi:hypothetical protein
MRASTTPAINRSAARPIGRCCGGNGHCFGNHRSGCSGTAGGGARSAGPARHGALGRFFRALPWSELVPDLDRKLVTGGLGEARGLDRVTASVTSDRRLGVAYLPVRRPIEVQLGTLQGPRLAAEWFDPASGRRASGGILAAEGTATLAPPIEEDAVLTLASCA